MNYDEVIIENLTEKVIKTSDVLLDLGLLEEKDWVKLSDGEIERKIPSLSGNGYIITYKGKVYSRIATKFDIIRIVVEIKEEFTK